MAHVLIETSWNVKIYKKSVKLVAGKGINRNIVECKEIVFGEAGLMLQY